MGGGGGGIFLQLLVHLFREIGEEDEKTAFCPSRRRRTVAFWPFRLPVLPPWVAGLASRTG
jgi:hypothetical protein